MNPILDDEHYKKHVTDTGEVREIVVYRDIYSYGGVKLLSVGARITSAMYERIVNHMLQHKLEDSLSIANPFGRENLLETAQKLIERLPLLARMQKSLSSSQSILKVLGSLSINQQMAFKLSIAREKMPDLLQHSVETAIFSTFLGFKARLDATQIVSLATAALFHDLGELHINPVLMDRKRSLSADERKHFYAHPLTMYMLLKEFREYHPAVSTPVLEHHERLDGSGYPGNLKQNELGKLGCILAVAELAASMYRGGDNTELRNIETTLKFNMRHQLDATVVSNLLEILGTEESALKAQRESSSIDRLKLSLQKMAEIFSTWNEKFLPRLESNSNNEALMFLSENLHMLKLMLEDSGFNGAFPGQLTDFPDENSQELEELDSLYHEFVWKIRDMINELNRRWPDLENASINSGNDLVREWIITAQHQISA